MRLRWPMVRKPEISFSRLFLKMEAGLEKRVEEYTRRVIRDKRSEVPRIISPQIL
jgi:hypothetical protein